MRKTNISQKVSIVNYFISALGNLKKGTDTNKLLLKIWLLSSTITFIISVIALSMIGTLNTDTIFIKIVIYLSLFGISSIVPFIVFSGIYYLSLVVEKLNLFFNFLYLIIIREILIEKFIKIILLTIKREFRLSNKEIISFVNTGSGFLDKAINYFIIFKKLGTKEFKHTGNIVFYTSIISLLVVFSISMFIFSKYNLDINMIISLFTIVLLFMTISLLLLTAFILLVLVKFFPKILMFLFVIPIVIGLFALFTPVIILIYVYALIIKIIYRIKLFFVEMAEEYQGSKVEVYSYIEAKIQEN